MSDQFRPYEQMYSIYCYVMSIVNVLFYILNLVRVWKMKTGKNTTFWPTTIFGTTAALITTTFTAVQQLIGTSQLLGFYTIGLTKVSFCTSFRKFLHFFPRKFPTLVDTKLFIAKKTYFSLLNFHNFQNLDYTWQLLQVWVIWTNVVFAATVYSTGMVVQFLHTRRLDSGYVESPPKFVDAKWKVWSLLTFILTIILLVFAVPIRKAHADIIHLQNISEATKFLISYPSLTIINEAHKSFYTLFFYGTAFVLLTELVFSLLNLYFMFKKFRKLPVVGDSRTPKMKLALSRFYAANTFVTTFFFFLPTLGNSSFYLLFGEKPLLYLLSPSIFYLYLPINFIVNFVMYPSVEREFCRQRRRRGNNEWG
jgi:hypothetical protein